MEKQLDQSTIDAMFAVAQSRIGSAAEDSDAVPTTISEPYNFSRAGQINNDQMRAISTVNNLFARNLMHTLGAWLRSQCDVRLVAGEQLAYSDFVERLVKPVYVCSIRLAPFDALGLLQIDLSLALPIIDVLLGGVGRSMTARELTDIEESILGSVVHRILLELNTAWQPVGLEMDYERRETDDQIERMMMPLEKTLCVSFEARMDEAQGMLNLCFPASVLNAILRRLVAEEGRPRRRPLEARSRMRELIGQTTIGTVLQFPPMRMSAKQLADLVKGSVLRLPLPKHADAELRVGGLVFGRAQPVRSGEHRGARLEPAMEIA